MRENNHITEEEYQDQPNHPPQQEDINKEYQNMKEKHKIQKIINDQTLENQQALKKADKEINEHEIQEIIDDCTPHLKTKTIYPKHEKP